MNLLSSCDQIYDDKGSHVPLARSRRHVPLRVDPRRHIRQVMTPIQPSKSTFRHCSQNPTPHSLLHFASSAAQNAKIRMLLVLTSQTNSQISASTREGGGASQECQLEDGHTLSESSSELVVLTTFVRSGHGVETVPVPRLSSFCLRGTSSQSHLTYSCAQSAQRLAQSASKFLIFATRSVRTEPMSFSSLPCFDWIRTMPQWTSTTDGEWVEEDQIGPVIHASDYVEKILL